MDRRPQRQSQDIWDTSDQTRPDGRISSEELLELRAATRALRNHLDELPIDFTIGAPAEQYFAEVAFGLARHHYSCAESMLGAGFGGAVIGSISRSIFLEGLRWRWVCEDTDARRTSIMASTLDERNRILRTLSETESTCPALARWFVPAPEIVDLTGLKINWMTAPILPTDEALIEGARWPRVRAAHDVNNSAIPSHLADGAWSLVTFPGIQGAVSILKHAGHGNQLGLQSCLTESGAAGHDLRPDHEALFMQLAAVGVANTLVGSVMVDSQAWPAEFPMIPFIEKTIELTRMVSEAAVKVHGLSIQRRSWPSVKKSKPDRKLAGLSAGVFVQQADLLEDRANAAPVIEAAEEYASFAVSTATEDV